MLKIKDNVDLKELEKFGVIKLESFPPSYIYPIGAIMLDGEDFVGWFDIYGFEIKNQKGHHELNDLNLLYDLIKAGLVEKVDY